MANDDHDPMMQITANAGQYHMAGTEAFWQEVLDSNPVFAPVPDRIKTKLANGVISMFFVCAAMEHPEWGQAIALMAHRSPLFGGGDSANYRRVLTEIVQAIPITSLMFNEEERA